MPKGVPADVVKKLEAAIADTVRDPDYVKSSPGDEPVLAFMPGGEWQKRLKEQGTSAAPDGGRDESKRGEISTKHGTVVIGLAEGETGGGV